MNTPGTINYVEFPAKDIEATKRFFETVFSWTFRDFGPEYSTFSDQGINGGFYAADMHSSCDKGAALIVLYSEDLETTKTRIEQADGAIIKPIFSFPGGRRFHFREPSGNEMAVWSDKEVDS